jgi:hypothetical protein
MVSRRLLFAVLALAQSQVAVAQPLEVMPFAGYRFGGDLFESAIGHPVDADGAPAVGAVVNIPLGGGQFVEGLFTHQRGRITTTNLFGDRSLWNVTVDHWQVGGLQELLHQRVRPFLTGLIGLSRYAVEDDSEMRFVAGGGGGVKLFPAANVGVRLDGRLFATFVDVEGRAVACGAGPCLIALDVDVIWQAEFSAGNARLSYRKMRRSRVIGS